MIRAKLSDFFRGDFLSIINSHKKRIQEILKEYDIAIFMARKAICFFDALMMNGELSATSCHVISSRVIDYNGLHTFLGKKVAVVDDVVVKGTSIKRVAEELCKNGVVADYFVIACDESFSQSFMQENIKLNNTYTHYVQSDIYMLSGLITQYIEASMRTFNVDSPIYFIKQDKNTLNSLLNGKGAVDLSSGIQKKYGILNKDIYFKLADSFNDTLSNVLKKAIIKIRFYSNEERTIAVPFVLLSKCDAHDLDLLYELFSCDDIDFLLYCENEYVHRENKFKLVSYILASILFSLFARNYRIEFETDDYFDIIQFNMAVRRTIKSEQIDCLNNIFGNIEILEVDFSLFKFSKYIRSAYGFIAAIDPKSLPYTNRNGQLIGGTTAVEHEQNRLNGIVFSIEDLCNGINPSESDENLVYISSVLDVFIDKGFIVPSIVHIGNNHTLRAYKMGEYSKLTREQLLSFVKMVSLYQVYTNHNLDRTEFEKLCVLFFRMQINNHNFGEETEYDEGCYGISYSYYGPRISESEEMYNVSQNSALITDFIECKIVQSQSEKYYVAFMPDIKDFKLDSACNTFAYDYSELYKIFCEHPYNKANNPWNQYIHTYDQYLTILAIGDNRKNQILSLCAEIYQILCMKNDMFIGEIDHLPIKRYKLSLSGVNSGLWKYRCFKNEALKTTTEKIKEYGNAGILRGIIEVNTPFDRGTEIVSLRDAMGDYLYRAAYVINKLLVLTGRIKYFRYKSLDDTMIMNDNYNTKTIFGISNFYYKEKKILKDEIEKSIDQSVELIGIEGTINSYWLQIKLEAQYRLDQCDLFLEKSSPNLNLVKSFMIAYSPSGDLPYDFVRSKECAVKNLTEKSKIAIFSIVTEHERADVVDKLMCDTQDVKDCIYILVDSLKDEYSGYVQFDNVARGTYLVGRIKELLKIIDGYPDKEQRLFILRQRQSNIALSSFNKTNVNCIKKSICNSETYCLDIYSIERETAMDDNNKGITVGGNFTIGGNFAYGNNNIQQGTFGYEKEELTKLIQTVLEASKELSPKEQEEVREYIDVVQTEVVSGKPKKNMIKTALNGLKSFVTNEKFVDAVAKLSPAIIGIIEKL